MSKMACDVHGCELTVFTSDRPKFLCTSCKKIGTVCNTKETTIDRYCPTCSKGMADKKVFNLVNGGQSIFWCGECWDELISNNL